MGILSPLSTVASEVSWMTFVGAGFCGSWLLGKRVAGLRNFAARYLVLIAISNLFVAPILVLLIGAIAQTIASRFGADSASAHISTILLLALFLVVAWCMARLVELFLLSKRSGDGANHLPALQRGLLFGAFLFTGFAVFIFVQGYSITGLYISTGAAAALVAFAMQQTLGDLFSGIALSIEHPFKLGERIRLADGSEGRVIDINWRATRLQAWDNSTIVVPNSQLAKQGITNLHGADHPYAPWYEVKIPAEVDPRLAQALLLEAALRCSKVLKTPFPLVRLTDATTVPYTYMIWVHFPNYVAMFAGREQLFQEIHYALKDVGAHVSPSISEFHMRQVETSTVEPPTTNLALRMLDIAKSLSDAELEELAAMSIRFSVEAGTVLSAEGDTAKGMDVIIHGVVEASVTTDTGKPKVVDQLRSGEYFGLTSMFMETPSFLKFTASTNVTLLRIDVQCLQKILIGRTDLHDEFAIILKQRMDAAENARIAGPPSGKQISLKDVLRRIEKWTF